MLSTLSSWIYISQFLLKIVDSHICAYRGVPQTPTYISQFLLKIVDSHICAYRGVPHTPTLRIPLKLQPKPRVLGFFDMTYIFDSRRHLSAFRAKYIRKSWPFKVEKLHKQLLENSDTTFPTCRNCYSSWMR